MEEMEIESEFIHLENRIRSLLSELVGPIINRVKAQDLILEKLQKHDYKHKIRYTDLNNFVQRSVVRLVPIEEFNKKIYDFFSESRNLESSTTRRLEFFSSTLNQLTHHVEYLKSSNKTLEEVQKNNDYYFKVNERLVRESKELLKKQMTNLENSLQKNMYETAHVLENISGKVDQLAYHFNELNDKTLPGLQFFIKSVKEKSTALAEKVDKVQKEKVTMKDIKDFKVRIDTDASNLRNKVNTDLKVINTFFDKSLKFDVTACVFDVLLDFASLEKIDLLSETIKSNLDSSVRLVNESKDIKSENYQLPAQIVSQLIHQRRVFEKQLKMLEEKKKNLELIQSVEKSNFLQGVKNFNEASGRDSNSYLKSMSPGIPKSPQGASGEKIVTGPILSRKTEEFVSEKLQAGLNSVKKNEPVGGNGVNNEKKYSSLSPIRTGDNLVISKTVARSSQLSIGGKTQVNILKTPKNAVENVQDLNITPNIYRSSHVYSLKAGLNSEKMKIRDSFLVLPNEKVIKAKTPVLERHKLEQKLEKSQKIRNIIKDKIKINVKPGEDEIISRSDSSVTESKHITLNPKEENHDEIPKKPHFEANNSDKKSKKSNPTPKIPNLELKNSTSEPSDSESDISDSKIPSFSRKDSKNSSFSRKDSKNSSFSRKDSKNSSFSRKDSTLQPQSKILQTNDPEAIPKLLLPLSPNPDSVEENPMPPKETLAKLSKIEEEAYIAKPDSSNSDLQCSSKDDFQQYESKKQELFQIQEELSKLEDQKTDTMKKAQNDLMAFTSEFVKKELSNLENLKKESIKTIKESADNVRKMIVKDQEELRLNMRLLYDENHQMIKQRTSDMQKIETELKTLTASQSEISNSLNFLKEQSSSQKNFQDCLCEAIKILHNLIKQDEKDRENLQLTGFGETRSKSVTKHKPHVMLKAECLSCSGQASSIYSAFKIACLNYSPSEIIFNNKRFPRLSLIKLLGDYISHIHEYPYYVPKISESKATEQDEGFLKINSKTPKISARFLSNNSSFKVSELDSTILRKK